MTRLLDRIGQKSHRWVFVLIISGVLAFGTPFLIFFTRASPGSPGTA